MAKAIGDAMPSRNDDPAPIEPPRAAPLPDCDGRSPSQWPDHDGRAPPQTLDHAAIARLVPHQNAMCLLDRLLAWSPTMISCTAVNHRDASHPLRSASGLLASATIEYAAQAMALHGALLGLAAARAPAPGFLASARGVVLERVRLDDLPRTDSSPTDASSRQPECQAHADLHDALVIEATRQAGDERQLLYAFTVSHARVRVASGRVAVVLDAALGRPPG